jgi:CubicO group peptidase (beta-lactamase class C family)
VDGLHAEVDRVASRTRFSGVVRVDGPDGCVLELARGLACRAHGVANTPSTRFGLASATKGWTALTVLALVAEGTLELSTTARSLLGTDLPLVDDGVTVEQLLAHRSGIGDYLDEDQFDDATAYVLSVPVHRLATTEAYLAVLDGYPTAFPPGTAFAYCNGGYVLLALLAERAAGVPFHELVDRHVCRPAGLTRSAFLRADELPADVAVGYLDTDGLRSNVLHLPVRGSGDGGIHAPVDDVHRLWQALFDGRIVAADLVTDAIRPRSTTASGRARYGLGFWLGAEDDRVELQGADAGVSVRTVHRPSTGTTWTVVSNTTDGAWPVARAVEAVVDAAS